MTTTTTFKKAASLCGFVLALNLTSFASAARADDEPPDYAADTLTGDWDGKRTRLFDKGLDVGLSYRLETFRNTSGGVSRGGASTGLTDLRLQFDLDKLLGWDDTRAFIHLMNHSLGRINAAHVGSLTGVSNIETLRNSTKFYRFWVERELAEQRLAVMAGLLPLEDEFFTMSSAGTIIHPTAGPQADLALTRGPAIYNNAALGFRLKAWSEDQTHYAMVAILDRPEGDTNNFQGAKLQLARIPGAHVIGEIGLTPLAAANDKGDQENFDKTALGLWRYTRAEDHLTELDAYGRPTKAANWGWYGMTEKTLYKSTEGQERTATGFVRYSGADGRSTAVTRSLNAGFRLKGLVPDRQGDITAVMIALHKLGQNWQQKNRANALPPAQSENILEINHLMAIDKGVSAQPMLQWITHPGGLREAKMAKLVGVRFMLNF